MSAIAMRSIPSVFQNKWNNIKNVNKNYLKIILLLQVLQLFCLLVFVVHFYIVDGIVTVILLLRIMHNSCKDHKIIRVLQIELFFLILGLLSMLLLYQAVFSQFMKDLSHPNGMALPAFIAGCYLYFLFILSSVANIQVFNNLEDASKYFTSGVKIENLVKKRNKMLKICIFLLPTVILAIFLLIVIKVYEIKIYHKIYDAIE